MDRPGTCIILDKKYNIANSSCHFGSYGSIWTGPSPKKYYMDLRSFGSYNIFLVTERSIYCHMTLSAMNYLLYILYDITCSKIKKKFLNKYQGYRLQIVRVFWQYASVPDHVYMRILKWFTRTRMVLFYSYLVIWSSETTLYEDPTRKVRIIWVLTGYHKYYILVASRGYKMKQTKFK
jgi:hypothetical protein